MREIGKLLVDVVRAVASFVRPMYFKTVDAPRSDPSRPWVSIVSEKTWQLVRGHVYLFSVKTYEKHDDHPNCKCSPEAADA